MTLTAEMQRFVRDQRLGFYATVSEDGSPNLSPKGTTFVWDDTHLAFADIRSPQTVENVRRGSRVEINLVDPLVRKGYRFKGPGVVYDCGSAGFSAGLELLRHEGLTTLDRARAIVVIEVLEARRLVSPIYDDGTMSEHDVAQVFRERLGQVSA